MAKQYKEIYLVLKGVEERILGWSEMETIAESYAEEYRKMMKTRPMDADAVIRVKKIKHKDVKLYMKKKDGGFNFFDRELICLGRGLYVPYKYKHVYMESAVILKEQYDSARAFLQDMINDTDFFSKKERKNFEATRLRMEIYFRRRYTELIPDELIEGYLDDREAFRNRFS